MRSSIKPPFLKFAVLPLALMGAFAHAQDGQGTGQPQSTEATETIEFDAVNITAERQLQQQLGVSRISAAEIEKRPAANDISELVRTMPGVNLTGNTATGQRGNKRQIDLRGMGPEWGTDYGVFHDRPVPALIEALDILMATGA